MRIICFDLGGTIINDPFDDIVKDLKNRILNKQIDIPFDNQYIEQFFQLWKTENRSLHFEHASHFLQEEIWPMRAAIKLMKKHNLNVEGDLPILIPLLIQKYRTTLKEKLKKNQFVEKIKDLITEFQKEDIAYVVASNDREIATRAMLKWSNLLSLFDEVYTSEWLSTKYKNAEKPSKHFFLALKNELSIKFTQLDQLIYIGDSESNDIIPAKKCGFVTVRFVNKKNPKESEWIDQNDKTDADYFYKDSSSLKTILGQIL